MFLKSALALTLVCASVALVVSCRSDSGPSNVDGQERIEVRVGNLIIDAEVARTEQERQLGLGGRDQLARHGGMLFTFTEDARHTFWMRGMRFPLDFIWIAADGTVAEITANVPPPGAGTPDSDLQLLQPVVPVRYVLEVNAGVVAAGAVAVGDAVTFDPQP
ncbi:MAG: DUF192 domain-containing protein [Dehalococcoidia bacterium]